jgi:hypothetical protein
MPRFFAIVGALLLAAVVFTAVKNWPRDEFAGLSDLKPLAVSNTNRVLAVYFERPPTEIAHRIENQLGPHPHWSRQNLAQLITFDRRRGLSYDSVTVGGRQNGLVTYWPTNAQCVVMIHDTALAKDLWAKAAPGRHVILRVK